MTDPHNGNATWFHYIDGVKHTTLLRPEVLERVKKFKVHDDDVLIAGYPRSGNHWLAEIVRLVVLDEDPEKVDQTHFHLKSSPIEIKWPLKELPNIDYYSPTEHQRIIKTHLAPNYWEEQMAGGHFKIIYIIRHMKDVLVSSYHMAKDLMKYSGSWDDFIQCLMDDALPYESPSVAVGRWLEKRSNPNIMFIHYEQIKQDPRGSITRIGEHLGKEIPASKMEGIIRRVSLANMKKNMKEGSAFVIRKGESGGWREYFNDEQSKKVDEMMEKAEAKYGFTYIQL